MLSYLNKNEIDEKDKIYYDILQIPKENNLNNNIKIYETPNIDINHIPEKRNNKKEEKILINEEGLNILILLVKLIFSYFYINMKNFCIVDEQINYNVVFKMHQNLQEIKNGLSFYYKKWL